MVNFQEYLDGRFPTQQEKEQVKEIKGEWKDIEGGELDLRAYQNLETVIISGQFLKSPLTKLELGNHPNLTLLTLNSNQLTSLDIAGCPSLVNLSLSFNRLNLVGFLKQLPHPEKLKVLNIARNDFQPTTLDFLSQFTNLKRLTLGTAKKKIDEGIYNRFSGSLEPLKNLTNLELLCIAGTDVDRGLEYLFLPEIEGEEEDILLDCRPLVPHAKVKAIKDELKPFDYDVWAWQLAHPKKMQQVRPEMFVSMTNKKQWTKQLARKITETEQILAQKRKEGEENKSIKRSESKLKLLQEAKQKLDQEVWKDPKPSSQSDSEPENLEDGTEFKNKPPKLSQESGGKNENKINNKLSNGIIAIIAISVVIIAGIVGYVIYSKKRLNSEK